MKKTVLALCFLGSINYAYNQNNVGIGTVTPDASSALDIEATDQGILVPRIALLATNNNNPVAAPATSLLVYNTAIAGAAPNDVTPGYYFWDGTQWVRLLNGPAAATCVTLDEAYDCTTPGGGRTVEVNDGSIEFNQTAGTHLQTLSVTNTTGTLANPSDGIFSYQPAIGSAVLGVTDATSADQVYAPITGIVESSTTSNSGVFGAYDGSAPFGNGGSFQSVSTDGGLGSISLNFSPSITSAALGSYSWSQGGGANTYGLQGVAGDGSGNILITSSADITSAGVYGINESVTGGAGVFGEGVNGVVGLNDYTDGYAVFGMNYGNQNVAGGIDQIGVLGDGYNGVWGQTVYDDGFGTYGLIDPTLGDVFTGAGTVGEGSGNDFGVFALGDEGATGIKAFFIDHPLDPENKILRHYSIESNEPVLLYRGTVELDENGNATISLPDYIDAINIEYSYTLTSVGAAAPNLHISQEITGGQFVVAGGAPNKKASWVVYGKRNDAYLQMNPEKYEVEITKQGTQQGKYADPVSHGKNRSESMFRNSGKRQVLDANGERKKDKKPVELPKKPVTKR